MTELPSEFSINYFLGSFGAGFAHVYANIDVTNADVCGRLRALERINYFRSVRVLLRDFAKHISL